MGMYIHTLGNNITKSRALFLQLIYTLSSQGETMQYILTVILKGCGSCEDNFVCGVYPTKTETL